MISCVDGVSLKSYRTHFSFQAREFAEAREQFLVSAVGRYSVSEMPSCPPGRAWPPGGRGHGVLPPVGTVSFQEVPGTFLVAGDAIRFVRLLEPHNMPG